MKAITRGGRASGARTHPGWIHPPGDTFVRFGFLLEVGDLRGDVQDDRSRGAQVPVVLVRYKTVTELLEMTS